MGIGAFAFYVIVGLVSVLYFVLKKRFSYWKDRNIPHDKPSLLYGNMEGVGTRRHFYEAFREVYKHHKGSGPFAGIYFFLTPGALILDLDLVKNILIKDFSNFADRGVFHNERDDPLTGHLFALDGQRWKQLRNKLSPTFTSGKMKFMYPTVRNVAQQFGDVFGEMVKRDSIVEIRELLARFTTDVIGTCAFGIDCNSLKDPNAEFRLMGKKVFVDRRHHTIVEGFMQSFPELAKKLRMKQVPDDVGEFFMKVVEETVEFREKNNIHRNDFMDLLIELKNNKSAKMPNGEVISGITMNELAAQAFVFFLAGFETSSTTMGFCLYELAQHQDIQDRLRKEINEVLNKFNGEFSYECMKEMKYLDQVLCETLRKYPVVQALFRKALNDYPIPGTKYVIEKGTIAFIPADAIQHDPEIYPDPEKFDPERFTPEEIQKRHPVAWLPFGDGPRNCIGLRFGKMQANIGLVTLLTRFKFSVCSKTVIPIQIDPKGIIVGSLGGIYLKVENVA